MEPPLSSDSQLDEATERRAPSYSIRGAGKRNEKPAEKRQREKRPDDRLRLRHCKVKLLADIPHSKATAMLS